jgi:hypothetical protein
LNAKWPPLAGQGWPLAAGGWRLAWLGRAAMSAKKAIVASGLGAAVFSLAIFAPIIFARATNKDAGELQLALERSKLFTLDFSGTQRSRYDEAEGGADGEDE